MNFIDSRSSKLEVFQPEDFVTIDDYNRLNTPMTASISENTITLSGEWEATDNSIISFTLSSDVTTPSISFGGQSYQIKDSQGAAVSALKANVGQVLLFVGGSFYTLGGGGGDVTKAYVDAENAEQDTAISRNEQGLISLNTQVGSYFNQLNTSKANKATFVESTMVAASWANSEYSFEATYPGVSYDIEIQPSGNCTQEQLEAWGAAQLVGNITNNTAKALGTVPTVDIPIIIKVLAK